ncbi:hypothetical protein [Escherichia coli]|uniref:hypothetical protein n=1 Tax=Escherichia coli TaxID=562 RepID=UPI00092DE98A|nr:hypothetical protein [Escherichia coli]APL06678.1 hypothetical protein RG56_25750 [Escherichia coli]APL16459.1 hypothetical protein RG58_25710 [Escherichia coli]APL26094.1 hypothetical protein RG60_25575 [Escherichia coli]APL31116.1 hypothetical protein RG61_25780 [Escherichia coli]APL40939.1 hypothetical protein RG63_25385 [Escherichia coli]
MHKSDAEKIDLILDEHERIFRKQRPLYMALSNGALITGISCVIATFCVSGLYLKSLCLSVACCCGVFSRIFNYYSVPEESRMVLSRQELLWLMSLTEDCPDVRQELLNRLLSGKKLTGLDKKEIRSLWWEKMDAMQESATRRHEQDAIRKFVGEDKSE